MLEQKIRSFICIDFPHNVVKEIARIQSLIKNKPFTGKLTELENLHLTLKFLGEISQEQIEKVKEELSKIKFEKFEARLGEAGTFSLKTPRIAWLKVGGKGIFNLQRIIDLSLENLFKSEERFMSHLTIARIKYVKDKKDFIEYIKNLSVKPLKFEVKSFKLMSSELKDFGPVYKLIGEFIVKDISPK